MSVLDSLDGPTVLSSALFCVGQRYAKEAAEATVEPAYNLTGMLYLDRTGWLVLGVPNALVRGLFAAMREPGIELPVIGQDRNLSSCIAVMSPAELTGLGGPEKITERGKHFEYTLGRLVSVKAGLEDTDKVWAYLVHSPALQQLRRSYGLSGMPNADERAFYVVVAVRRSGVLGRNTVSKG